MENSESGSNMESIDSVIAEKPENIYREPYDGQNLCHRNLETRISSLRASKTIPANTFLFYYLSDEIDLFVNAKSTHTTVLWEQMAIFGAGNTFYQSLASYASKESNVSYENAIDINNRLWDFRFINHSDMTLSKSITPPNVKLRSAETVIFPKGKFEGERKVRAFYTTTSIREGEELLWDYTFHRKNRIKPDFCDCGETIESCKDLKALQSISGRDPAVEKIYRKVDQKSDNVITTRLLVKYENLDLVCNEYVEDLCLEKTDVYIKWKKKEKKRIRREQSNMIVTIGTNLADRQDNADYSSGAEDEDERAPAKYSKPKEVLYMCRENHLTAENVKFYNIVYALYTNQEVFRHEANQFVSKYPELILDYLGKKDISVDKIETDRPFSQKKLLVGKKRNEEVDMSKCILPHCKRIIRQDKTTNILHLIAHCGLFYVANLHNSNFIMEEEQIVKVENIKEAIRRKEPYDRVLQCIYKLDYEMILEGAFMLKEKYPTMESIEHCIEEIQTEKMYQVFVGEKVELRFDSLKCEFCGEIFIETVGLSATKAFLIHKFKSHFDAVIRNTFFPRRVEPGYKESVYCPEAGCNVKSGGEEGNENLILHMKLSHPEVMHKVHKYIEI